jgi:hypothetical protein
MYTVVQSTYFVEEAFMVLSSTLFTSAREKERWVFAAAIPALLSHSIELLAKCS